ncbi:MAG: radical SAM superfamily enzyme YgiQ (UPF0313 family) [Limisphaerales bacterium]|jgi:radical SAM superfamily enzyme YgiQ (UPF0313 family)
MPKKVLLITPPFTQLNTPYPGTAYLKGFLNTVDINCTQADLGIEVILLLFSKKGLTDLFNTVDSKSLASNEARIYSLRSVYIETIKPVIEFLQDKNPTLAHQICSGNYLPQASRFDQLEELEWAFGSMGIRDKARHLATLYLEDLSDLIKKEIDPHFGFSRYAERLGQSANSFDELYESLKGDTYIDQIHLKLLADKIKIIKPDLIGLSVPFPGNLYSAFKAGQFIKKNYPNIKVAFGGGFANTELRQITDPRVFEFIDYITLDDGETPILNLLEYLEGTRPIELLKRTLLLEGKEVTQYNGSLSPDVKQEFVGTPDYSDLPLSNYLSVIEIANPMHRLWSDGRWNKLTMAHGCYWGKCTFCDISLDYIKRYEASSAKLLADRVETLITQTGQHGFHFVDEAAPPALMGEFALEVIKRKLTVTWWTNIRFEKSFTPDLCRLLAASGCIAISGGLEVASDRLLKLIDKGVTVAQVAKVTESFTESGIMVHAYLMYGFPTETDQETIDSLETVRQLFESGIIQSGFWHQFAMTAHSPVGMMPEQFKVKRVLESAGSFANNDLEHIDSTGTDHTKYSEGLRKSLFNYMHGICFEFSLQEWFDFEIPKTTIPDGYIQDILFDESVVSISDTKKLVWLGNQPELKIDNNKSILNFSNNTQHLRIKLDTKTAEFLVDQLRLISDSLVRINTFRTNYEANFEEDFLVFWHGRTMTQIREFGLLII